MLSQFVFVMEIKIKLAFTLLFDMRLLFSWSSSQDTCVHVCARVLWGRCMTHIYLAKAFIEIVRSTPATDGKFLGNGTACSVKHDGKKPHMPHEDVRGNKKTARKDRNGMGRELHPSLETRETGQKVPPE